MQGFVLQWKSNGSSTCQSESLTYGQLSDFHVSFRKTSVWLDCSWLIPAGSFKNICISAAVQTVYEQRMCMFATGAVELWYLLQILQIN